MQRKDGEKEESNLDILKRRAFEKVLFFFVFKPQSMMLENETMMLENETHPFTHTHTHTKATHRYI